MPLIAKRRKITVISVVGKKIAGDAGMKTAISPLTRDGDDIFIAVPENRTLELYQYLRCFGFCFTVDSRGFCEDNVFSFPPSENIDRLNAILQAFFV